MHTARSSSRQAVGGSASVHAGILPPMSAWIPLPGCGPGDPPPGCGPGDTPLGLGLEIPPTVVSLETPPRCGPGDPPSQTPPLSTWVWAWKPARHAGIPPPSSMWTEWLTDMCKNITFANFVCGGNYGQNYKHPIAIIWTLFTSVSKFIVPDGNSFAVLISSLKELSMQFADGFFGMMF